MKMAQVGDTLESKLEKKKKDENKKVPFYKLFSFADRRDSTLMIVGTIAAIGNGLSQPIMTLIFGELINSFGGTEKSHVVHEISKTCLKLVYLAIGAGSASLLQMVCWMVTGERQAARIRGLYLKTILRQDIEFFDTQTTTGEVIGRMSGDTDVAPSRYNHAGDTWATLRETRRVVDRSKTLHKPPNQPRQTAKPFA